MLSADAWLAMCQPSASRAMEPKTMPAAISMTIMTAVSAITSRVWRSFCSSFAPR